MIRTNTIYASRQQELIEKKSFDAGVCLAD